MQAGLDACGPTHIDGSTSRRGPLAEVGHYFMQIFKMKKKSNDTLLKCSASQEKHILQSR